MSSNKHSEAEKELERMFGPEEEFGMGPIERFRLKLVQKQYKKSSLAYRMFFDKNYR